MSSFEGKQRIVSEISDEIGDRNRSRVIASSDGVSAVRRDRAFDGLRASSTDPLHCAS
jgi:hypothetical protein